MRTTMRPFVLCAALLSMLPATGFGQKPEPTPAPGKIKWVFDYEEAKVLGETTQKPLFVVIRCER